MLPRPLPLCETHQAGYNRTMDESNSERLLSEQLEVVLGDASSAEARVFFRLPRDGFSATAKLEGVLKGPRSRYAHTLQAKIPIQDAGPGETLVGKAFIPDPCFWEPRQPFLYAAELTVWEERGVVAEVTQPVGLRAVWTEDRQFMLQGRPYLLRAARVDAPSSDQLSQWREAGVSPWVLSPSAELCAAASELGVSLVADFSAIDAEAIETLRRLSRWPALIAAVLPADFPEGARALAEIQGVWKGLRVADPAAPLPDWADFAVLKGDPQAVVEFADVVKQPMVICRPEANIDTAEAAGKELDGWQAEVEPTYSFAGYLLG